MRDKQVTILKNNISSLYKTARAELDRRQQLMSDLQNKYDQLVFRRNDEPKVLVSLCFNHLNLFLFRSWNLPFNQARQWVRRGFEKKKKIMIQKDCLLKETNLVYPLTTTFMWNNLLTINKSQGMVDDAFLAFYCVPILIIQVNLFTTKNGQLEAKSKGRKQKWEAPKDKHLLIILKLTLVRIFTSLGVFRKIRWLDSSHWFLDPMVYETSFMAVANSEMFRMKFSSFKALKQILTLDWSAWTI